MTWIDTLLFMERRRDMNDLVSRSKLIEEIEKAKTIYVDVGFGTIYETIRKDAVLEIVKRGCTDVKVLRKEGEKNDVD